MKCVKCGNELGENDMFCPICGTSTEKVNGEVKNQNIYTYDRPVNQQVNYGGQSNNYGQANNYGQLNNYEQQYGKSKNTNNIVKICVTIIIVFIILTVLLVIGIAKMKSNDETISKGNLSNDYSTTTPDTSTREEEEVTSISKSNSYKVSYAGFKLYIPDTLIYEIDDSNGAINIRDVESTWIAQLGIMQGSFQQLKQNRSYLSSYLMQEYSDVIISNATLETIGGVEYILLECNMAGTNIIIGYAGLNSMYSAYFEIINENNDFDRDTIKNLSPIISNAEYIGDSEYMKTNEIIKMTDINKALNKALEETNKDGE